MASALITIETVAPRPTVVIAQRTTWWAFAQLWRALLDEVYVFVRSCPDFAPGAGSGGVAADAASTAPRWQNVMLYLDDAPAVEVGVLAPGPFTPAGRVIASSLPGGRVARTVHRGSYADLGRAHAAVLAHAREHGFAPAGPRWEVYGHWSANPDELETEVSYLLLG